MPFLSFEEEITIKDRNSSGNHHQSDYHRHHRPSSFGWHRQEEEVEEDEEDEDEDESPMVLSDFGNVSMVVGASAFFDQVIELMNFLIHIVKFMLFSIPSLISWRRRSP